MLLGAELLAQLTRQEKGEELAVHGLQRFVRENNWACNLIQAGGEAARAVRVKNSFSEECRGRRQPPSLK